MVARGSVVHTLTAAAVAAVRKGRGDGEDVAAGASDSGEKNLCDKT